MPQTCLRPRFHLPATSPEDYVANGLGPQAPDAAGSSLYLDLMKRSVTNILYEDAPLAFYDQHQQPLMADGFDLNRRVKGEDLPTLALTMVGVKRLDNLQDCIEEAIKSNVPGDVVETGVLCGGASIFARSVLRAHGVADRRVFVCDAFVPPEPPLKRWQANVVGTVLYVVASIPSRSWQRRVLRRYQSESEQSMFPVCEDPSDDLVGFFMWALRHPHVLFCQRATGLDNVRSHFARYGLLDDQVVFLKGFFSKTLPDAPIERIAVLRLDGDTYESTMDVLGTLYPKLSPGGFCIIDDFHAFSDCRRAVEEYRAKEHVCDEIQPIERCRCVLAKNVSQSTHRPLWKRSPFEPGAFRVLGFPWAATSHNATQLGANCRSNWPVRVNSPKMLHGLNAADSDSWKICRRCPVEL